MHFTRVIAWLVFAITLKPIRQNNLTPNTIKVNCSSYKANENDCQVGYVNDTLINECIPNCDTRCRNGQCNYTFCVAKTINSNTDITICPHILCDTPCFNFGCTTINTNCCDKNYRYNPYNSECIPPCSKGQCENGWCLNGQCECKTGYRLDPTNVRTCIKVPFKNVKSINTTPMLEMVNDNCSLKAEKVVTTTTNKMYGIVIGSLVLNVLLLLTIIGILILILVLLKRKINLTHQGEIVRYHSSPKHVTNRINREILIENQDLYGEAS